MGGLHRRALDDYQYIARLAKAGFDDIDIEPTRVYNIEDAGIFLTGQGVDGDAIAPQAEGKFMSAFIRATKPANAALRAVARDTHAAHNRRNDWYGAAAGVGRRLRHHG